MSYAEFGRWIDYFNKNGRCGPRRMFDAGPALLAWKIDHLMGGSTTTIDDYLPKYGQNEVEADATVADIFREFGGVKKRG